MPSAPYVSPYEILSLARCFRSASTKRSLAPAAFHCSMARVRLQSHFAGIVSE